MCSELYSLVITFVKEIETIFIITINLIISKNNRRYYCIIMFKLFPYHNDKEKLINLGT